MWFNRPLREHVNRYPNLLSVTFDKVNPRAVEIDFEKLGVSLSLDALINVPFVYSGLLNLDVAVTNLVAVPGAAPWSPFVPATLWLRRGAILHIKRVVFDATTAATRLMVGSTALVANALPLTLPLTAGFADQLEFIVPPGYYVGLEATDNVGDVSRRLTISGEYKQLPVSGFDFGGTFIGLSS